jgi:hypothetical protein
MGNKLSPDYESPFYLEIESKISANTENPNHIKRYILVFNQQTLCPLSPGLLS